MTLPDLVTAKIPRGHLTILANVFYNMDGLSRQDSRKRTTFVKWLNKQQEEYLDDRKELIEELSQKDEEGVPITTTNDHGEAEYTIDPEHQQEFREAAKELQEELVTFGELSTQDLVRAIARISYNCQTPYSGAEAEVFDTFIENFDEMFDGFDKASEE